jgi:hypothetical protein
MSIKSGIALFFFVLLLASCVSTKKLLIEGDYDQVIDRCIKKLIKNPKSTEDADMLDRCYNLANDRDNSRTKFLRQEGNPAGWDEMFTLYSTLKNRQERVHKILPMQIGSKTVNYPQVDYDSQIIEAKGKATDYFYTNGKQLMSQNNRNAYRDAYYQISKAKSYNGGAYLDADNLIQECRIKGISRAIVQVDNRTMINLPDTWVKDVLTFNTDGLNSDWVEFDFMRMNADMQYDYVIHVILQEINISPDKQTERDFMVKKTVQDGFSYVLDANGNVRKDSAGNDMKMPRYKNLACSVIETLQQKRANLTGSVEFDVLNPATLLKQEPIGAETLFEWKSARAIGDFGALSPEQQKLTQVQPVPFPNDYDMIGRTTENIRKSLRDIIYRNKGFIK